MIESEVFSINNLDNPYEEYARLRNESPVWWSEEEKRWVLTRYNDIRLVLSDNRFSVGRQINNYRQLSEKEKAKLGDLGKFIDHDHTSFKADRPKHTRLKRVELDCITKASIKGMTKYITDLCNEIIDEKIEDGQMDIVADYAAPVALKTIAHYLGFPANDIHLVRDWVKRGANVRGMVGRFEAGLRYQEITTEIRTYLIKLIEEFRQEPKRGVIGDFIRMRDAGELEKEDELFWTIYTMMSAGHHTTLNTISNGMRSLLINRDQFELLINEPEHIGTAIDEIMRYDGYVQFLDRLAKEDVEISGVKIKKGDVIAVCIGAGNRDGEIFDLPNTMDITRKPNKHLGMGYSIHYCSGAGLGKHELEIAILTLAQRLPGLQLQQSQHEWGKSFNHRYLNELWVNF